ncbi:MAG: hypothetical protein LBQ88_12015, partial [Treponema sp.]|nr:hypothetical protein [Treponema sp.]
MSKKELAKLTLIQGAIKGVYAVSEAAKRLHLGGRRIKQLKQRMREHGEGAVIRGNSRRRPVNYKDSELRGNGAPCTASLTMPPAVSPRGIFARTNASWGILRRYGKPS